MSSNVDEVTASAGHEASIALPIPGRRLIGVTDLHEGGNLEELARVEPGVVCDALREAAEAHGLTFAPDPATHSRCTLGGMIGNNSCGPHSVMAGKTVENVERLEVLTYEGERFWTDKTPPRIERGLRAIAEKYGDLIRNRFPKIKRRVSGYNLDQLLPENGFNVARALVGSEGTCALTLQAEVRLVESPRHRVLVVAGFPDIFAAGDAVPQVLAAGPIACEGLDEAIIGGLRSRGLRLADIALLPPGKAWLMLEFGSDSKQQALEKARSVPGTVIEDPVLMARIWSIRETGASATALNLGGRGPDPVVGWEDAAVDPMRLGGYPSAQHGRAGGLRAPRRRTCPEPTRRRRRLRSSRARCSSGRSGRRAIPHSCCMSTTRPTTSTRSSKSCRRTIGMSRGIAQLAGWSC